MNRGKNIFICNDCKKIFAGNDFEYNATIFSQPLKCPKCKKMHTKPLFASKSAYKRIWESTDAKS